MARGALRHSNYDVKVKSNKIEISSSETGFQRKGKIENNKVMKNNLEEQMGRKQELIIKGAPKN